MIILLKMIAYSLSCLLAVFSLAATIVLPLVSINEGDKIKHIIYSFVIPLFLTMLFAFGKFNIGYESVMGDSTQTVRVLSLEKHGTIWKTYRARVSLGGKQDYRLKRYSVRNEKVAKELLKYVNKNSNIKIKVVEYVSGSIYHDQYDIVGIIETN